MAEPASPVCAAWIYENQERIAPDDLRRAARLLGLDGERFDEDLASRPFAPRVREDCLGGVRSGVNGTPTFFITAFAMTDLGTCRRRPKPSKQRL